MIRKYSTNYQKLLFLKGKENVEKFFFETKVRFKENNNFDSLKNISSFLHYFKTVSPTKWIQHPNIAQ